MQKRCSGHFQEYLRAHGTDKRPCGIRGSYGTFMARNSWGSTRKLPSGRVQARYTGPDGGTHKAPDTFPDELSALGWLADKRREIDLGIWAPPSTEPVRTIPTVGEMVSHWLSQCESAVATGEMRETSLVTYTNIVEKRITPYTAFTGTPVDELTPVMVSRWWQSITTDFPTTPDRNKRAYSKLKSAIALAVEYGYLQTNPVQVQAARKRAPSKRKSLPTTAELQAILDQVADRFKLGVCLCLFHGLRVGEMLALQAKHFEATAGGGIGIRIEGNLQRVPNGRGGVMMKWQPPKTEAGYRVVPVLAEFLPLVRRHLKMFTTAPEDYATTTAKGKMMMDTSFRSVFNRARDKANVDPEITPHYGRNWLITRLAEAGATPKEIGRILGQEDVSTIVGVYMRVWEQRPSELMKKIKTQD